MSRLNRREGEGLGFYSQLDMVLESNGSVAIESLELRFLTNLTFPTFLASLNSRPRDYSVWPVRNVVV